MVIIYLLIIFGIFSIRSYKRQKAINEENNKTAKNSKKDTGHKSDDELINAAMLASLFFGRGGGGLGGNIGGGFGGFGGGGFGGGGAGGRW